MKILIDFYKTFKKAAEDTFITHDGIEHSGYMSFLTILAICPVLIFFMAFVSQFGEMARAQNFLENLFQNIPQEIFDPLLPRLSELLHSPQYGLLTFSILGTLWTSSSLIEGMRTIFNRAYRVTNPPSYLLRRMMSVAYFILFIFILFIMTFVNVILPIIDNILDEYTNWGFVSYDKNLFHSLGIFFISFCMVTLFYNLIPNTKQKWSTCMMGSVITNICWLLFGRLFAFLVNYFEQVSIVYGSLQNIIISLLYMYIIHIALVFGAEFSYHFQDR